MRSFTISESNMTFGPFSDEECFHIELSNTYYRIRDSVKMVEFALLQNAEKDAEKLLFVKAKSSFPNPDHRSWF